MRRRAVEQARRTSEQARAEACAGFRGPRRDRWLSQTAQCVRALYAVRFRARTTRSRPAWSLRGCDGRRCRYRTAPLQLSAWPNGRFGSKAQVPTMRSARLDIIRLRTCPSALPVRLRPEGTGGRGRSGSYLALINRQRACSTVQRQSLFFRRQNVEIESF
jgi:hypothetical protein